uniref:DAGKc domain-containing protein n=1 Tax=Branchiostoma floridae TaxID=7739 RepID=C3YGG9_BRAFL|eukprot:XP_002604679.1 hypothetical protein BRAFLDRAFT_282352 [Branchiostoma floridae]
MPMMAEADVSISVVTTEYSGHAFDVVQSADLSAWGGIVVVSGDGVLYEVVNGLMSRPDWEQAIKIPLGILPAGSGNGLCYSINYALGEPFEEDRMVHSTFVLLKATMKGHTRPLDLMSVDTASERRYAFLSFQWGFSADVDIESERYRYLGGSRFLFGSLHNLMKLRLYRGKLSFLPPCPASGHRPRRVYGPPSPLLPPLDQPVPADWVTIETDFVTMIIQSISHISEGYFSSPCSSFDDGVLFLSFLKSGVSRRQMLKFMGKMAEGTQVFDFGSDGGYVCCKAFRVEPVTPPGLMTLDGEKIEYGPVQGQVHHGVINLIMPND